ncbi:hypothetical protein H2200_007997 [Cladophialophora chaetospira]|uniref:EGF-like domain-containing protein n=1 Tax=Cladophialophora chaetospira TaxID=386627 RepID=A0AA39CH45_9EURO|nr:hypothetical protein H2200_007997 [Cladophialophora chaetospira]
MDPHRPKKSNSSETRFHYSKPNYAQPSQYQQFPPHPGVRVPPNVKLSARQVPAGVGVAPPPVRYDSPSRPQHTPRSDGDGMLIQDFKFPAAPPPIPASSSSRSRQEPWQSSTRRYNMHDSYMSSVVNDYTPGTTPASKSRGFPTPTSRRYSGSVYAESEALGYEGPFDGSPETDADYSPEISQQVVRQASLGKRAKPAITTIRNRDSHLEQDIPESFPAPPTHYSRKATMEALSAAVAAGMSGQSNTVPRSETPVSRNHTPIRMPFDTSPPASPSADREFLQTPKTPATVVSSKMLGHHALPSSAHSQASTNPLLGLGIEQQPSMSDKIPASRRPPKLDMDAVRDAEARGSTTSLADLIKRATKLAANLDRGKTASRLGMLDMFGSSEKLGMGAAGNRHSTMSDMLSAFPAPAIGGTPTTKRDNDWPLGEKGDAYASTTDLSRGQPRKQRRKFCGMSLPILILVLTVIIILVAAAVLIPIFLILVPKQHKSSNDLSDCAASRPCRNGGTSIISNDACACVCSNGFTGSQCQTPGDTGDCMTITLNDGNTEYKNATVGSSVLPSFSDAQKRFDIPLNVSTILSVFSSTNLSCTSENSVVDFNSSALNSGSKIKRFIALPGLEPQPPAVDVHPRPPQISARAEIDCSKQHFERRQDGESAGTSNGIVFAQSSPTIGPIDPNVPLVTGVSTVTSVSGTTTPAASATASTSDSPSATSSGASASATVTDQELEFAKVVVLYVLQESLTVSVAVNAQHRMEEFFAQQTRGNSTSATVDVGLGDLTLTANFDKFSITKGNGDVVGGKGG